jgi:hypothetical protein
MQKTPILLGSIVALALCGTASAHVLRTYLSFSKTNTPYAEFWQDEIQCAAAARSTFRESSYGRAYEGPSYCVQFETPKFLSCMSAKGYSRDPKGYSTYMRWRAKASNQECDMDDDYNYQRMTKMAPVRVFPGPQPHTSN